MLTLDGTVAPMLGGGSGFGSGSGILGGVVAGGLAGLVGGMVGRGGFGGGNNWNNGGGCGNNGSPAADAAVASIVINPAFQSIQHQIDSLGNTINAHSTDNGITSVNQNVSGTSRDLLNSIANLSTAQATSAFTTLQSINDLGRDVTAQANQNALQQLNSFNQLTTATLQGFNGAAMQMQNSTNQIITQGTANAAAVATGFCQISKEISECCCDVKQLIQSDGSLTRSLINDLNVQSLRDQLVTANGKISNNEQNQILIDAFRNCNRPVCSVI